MIKKTATVVLVLMICSVLFTACSDNKRERIINVIDNSSQVLINDVASNTVEASLGAFEGKQGAYIEFIFNEPQEFNTIHIIEKTATVRQFNIYAEIDGKYTLIYTGKNILNDNITVEKTVATALKIEIVNTQIGNDNFIIQGVSAYNIKEDLTNVN